LEFDGEANADGGPQISKRESKVSVWVIPTDEDLMIARHTWQLLGGRQKREGAGSAKAAEPD
jgi:acetate kinase